MPHFFGVHSIHQLEGRDLLLALLLYGAGMRHRPLTPALSP